MKDSLCLAAMIRRFSREKEEIRKKNPATVVKLVRAPPNNTPTAAAVAPGNDLTMADLTSDPVVMMTLLGGATENDVLQELMGDLDFGLLDSPGPSSPGQSGERRGGGTEGWSRGSSAEDGAGAATTSSQQPSRSAAQTHRGPAHGECSPLHPRHRSALSSSKTDS